MEKIAILNKGINNATEDDFIKLSTNASLLYVIHKHVRSCEKIVYNPKNKSLASNIITTTDSDETAITAPESKAVANQAGGQISEDIKQNASKVYNVIKQDVGKVSDWIKQKIGRVPEQNPQLNQPINALIKKNGDATEELSIKGLETETEFNPKLASEKFFPASAEKKTKVKNTGTENLTEYINNLTSSEAGHLESAYDKNILKATTAQDIGKKKFDVNKPTLINYWADWCGYSQKFREHWEKFKSTADRNHPNLQVTELNVQRDATLNDLAKKVGVNGYPTLVLFNNGRKYHRTAGELKAEDVEKFVNEVLAT
jgi:thiol-disulfide isomerase/thioredoxin